jgi:uncharacterized protein with FMN-binding domain
MKKSVVIVLAVAILGSLGVYGKSHGSSGQASANNGNTATLGANTSAQTSNSMMGGSSSSPMMGSYKNGTYTGASEDTPYGTVQIAVVVSGGKISNVNFLQLPFEEGHSREVSNFASSLLKQETIQKQSPNIDFVSGATTTSEAYQQSLQSALDQAA